MSFFNLRRRQIDVDKQMPVIFGEIPEAELDSSHSRATIEVNVSNMPVEEQEEKHLREILGNAKHGAVEAIPTPHIQIVPGYAEEHDRFPLKTPPHYIRWSDIESNVSAVEYDLDDEDEAWLDKIQNERGVTISQDDFEYLIDFLEKQEYLYPMLKLKMERALEEVRPELKDVLVIVHDYWRDRVQREGRPLLRRFLNHAAERAPWTAFVIKLPTFQKDQIPKKKPLEEDRAMARLYYVRSHFLQMRLILAKILQREEMKREKVRMTQHLLELIVRMKRDPKDLAGNGAIMPYIPQPTTTSQKVAMAASAVPYTQLPGIVPLTVAPQNGISSNQGYPSTTAILQRTSSPTTSTTTQVAMNGTMVHRSSLGQVTASHSPASPMALPAGVGSTSSPSTSSLTTPGTGTPTGTPRANGTKGIILRTNAAALAARNQAASSGTPGASTPSNASSPGVSRVNTPGGGSTPRGPSPAARGPAVALNGQFINSNTASSASAASSTSVASLGVTASSSTSEGSSNGMQISQPPAAVPPPLAIPEPAGLEGEYALNPENLLRSYPYVGGMKKTSVKSSQPGAANGRANANTAFPYAANTPGSKPTNPKSLTAPFSSAQYSPFYDKLTGMRYDQYSVADEERIAIEELEYECDEDDEDEVIQMLENNVASLSSRIPTSTVVNDQGLLLYQPFGYLGSQSTLDGTYDPIDTLVRWNKQDEAFLRQAFEESTTYNPPVFTSQLPQPQAYQQPNQSQQLLSQQNSHQQATQTAQPTQQSQQQSGQTTALTTATAPTYVDTNALLRSTTSAAHERSAVHQPQRFQLPSVEPMLLSDPHPGFHVYLPRPAASGALPPRRFQVKTSITPSTINGMPFSVWATSSDVPYGSFGLLPRAADAKRNPSIRGNYDDYPAVSDGMAPPQAKRIFRVSNGEGSFYNADSTELSESLPDSIYHVAENSSYNLVDLGRTGLPAFRGRKRIGRGGRVIWDRVPTNAIPSSQIPTAHHHNHRVFQSIAQRGGPSHQAQTHQGFQPPQSESHRVPSVKLEYTSEVPSSTDLKPSFDLVDIERRMAQSGAMTATTTSPEPNSLDAMSGETTIANESGSLTPDESSTNGSGSPGSKAFPSMLENASSPPFGSSPFFENHIDIAPSSSIGKQIPQKVEEMSYL